MGEILFTALIFFEREVSIKISRVIRNQIKIDYVNNGQWKSVMQHCIRNKVQMDFFEKIVKKNILP